MTASESLESHIGSLAMSFFFFSRSNAITFINHSVYRYSKFPIYLNHLLTCFDLQKSLLKHSLKRAAKNFPGALIGLDRLATPEPHSIFT